MTFRVCIIQNTHKTQTTTAKYALITWYIIIVSKHNKFSCDGLRAYERYFDDEREDQKRFEKKDEMTKVKRGKKIWKPSVSYSQVSPTSPKITVLGRKANEEERDHI